MTMRHQCDVCGDMIGHDAYAYRMGLTRNRGWKERFFHVCNTPACTRALRMALKGLLSFDTADFDSDERGA